MKGPVFIFGGLVTSLVFLASAYALSGSIWTSLAATVVVVVVLQLGYAAYIAVLVSQERRRRAAAEAASRHARFSRDAGWHPEIGMGSDKPAS